MISRTQIVLLIENPSQKQQGLSLATRLNINIVSAPSDNFDFLLSLSQNGLSLRHPIGQIDVDFTSGKADYRRRHSGIKQEIAKAIGIKKDYKPTVLDATAGLAKDAFVLASLGCKVTLIEQSSIIAVLVADALERAEKNNEVAEIVAHMHLINKDSIQYMQQLTEEEKPDIVYLDPMFPERKKTALVKKEMQILQELLGHENQNDKQLFETALKTAKKRVVVKRPKSAETITEKKPDFSIKGKTCRFDVYLN